MNLRDIILDNKTITIYSDKSVVLFSKVNVNVFGRVVKMDKTI